jgi:DUF4097 and DUF4098 domain-containing protein YvlB
MQRTFATPGPTSLHVELGAGHVTVRAEQVDETRVEVHGHGADDTVVQQQGDRVVVIGPKGGLFRSVAELTVQVSMPVDSNLVAKLGLADLTVTGRIGAADLRTGTGSVTVDEIAGPAAVETGTGDIKVGAAAKDLKVRSGSGDVSLERLGASAGVATGSGDIQVGSAAAPVQLKSGSGDIRVGEAHDDVAATTASGVVAVETLHLGTLQAKNVSGDIRVGVPAGVPVWTDLSTLTGHIRSSLDSAGEPADGQPFIELRATTVSGDIRLERR